MKRRTESGSLKPLFRIGADRISFRNVFMQGPNGISIEASSVTLDSVWNYTSGHNWIVIERTDEGGGRNITLRNSGAREIAESVILAGSSMNLQVENCVFETVNTVYSFEKYHRGIFRNNWIRNVQLIISGSGENGQVDMFENIYTTLAGKPVEIFGGAKVQERNNIWYKDKSK
jgi:hypothetical protein